MPIADLRALFWKKIFDHQPRKLKTQSEAVAAVWCGNASVTSLLEEAGATQWKVAATYYTRRRPGFVIILNSQQLLFWSIDYLLIG